jgi:ABC-type transport system involved in multi-copper enzyme maturation permease subunit
MARTRSDGRNRRQCDLRHVPPGEPLELGLDLGGDEPRGRGDRRTSGTEGLTNVRFKEENDGSGRRDRRRFHSRGRFVQARPGPGPVFIYEWLTTTRRWQLYGLRAGFVFVILAAMVLIWRSDPDYPGWTATISRNDLARYGQKLYLTIVSIELAVVLLVAPAATAGAVCLDKARGTLDHMLATDLSNAEIVLGKLGVRLVPVLGLIACVLPLLALSGLLGGIDPNAVVGSFLAAIGCGVLGCSLALMLSVWGRKTRDVLMLTYLIMTPWLFSRYMSSVVWGSSGMSSLRFYAPAVSDWLDFLNPFYLVWAPYLSSGHASLPRFLGFLAVCLCVSGLLVGLATYRIRAVAQGRGKRRPARAGRRRFAGQLSRPRSRKWLPGPSLDGNPVFWREWYRAKPSRMMRVVWVMYSVMGMTWVVLALKSVASGSTNPTMISFMNVFQVGVGLLLLCVDAATGLMEERVSGSLDILLSTPLSTRSILAGKWAGTFRRVPQLLFAPFLTTLFLAWESGGWVAYVNYLGLLLAYSALIVSLGLGLATWQHRLERAIALCVAAYVILSIGWPFLLLPLTAGMRPSENLIAPLLMATPLFGTLFGTLAVAADSHNLRGMLPGSPAAVWIGCYVWIAIDGAAAAWLYAVTRATFDRCLGRMPESDYDVKPVPRGRSFSADWEAPFVAPELPRI